MWKDPTASINEENYVVQGSNAGQAIAVADSGLGTERGLAQKVRLIDELSASMVRAGQRKIVGGVLQPSKSPTECVVGKGESILCVGARRSGDGACVEPSFEKVDSAPLRDYVSPHNGDGESRDAADIAQKNVQVPGVLDFEEQELLEIDLTSEPEQSVAFARVNNHNNGSKAPKSAAPSLAKSTAGEGEFGEEASCSSEESDDGKLQAALTNQGYVDRIVLRLHAISCS